VRFGLPQWRQVSVMAIIVSDLSATRQADSIPRHSRDDHYPASIEDRIKGL